jgi:hypothetical protein
VPPLGKPRKQVVHCCEVPAAGTGGDIEINGWSPSARRIGITIQVSSQNSLS